MRVFSLMSLMLISMLSYLQCGNGFVPYIGKTARSRLENHNRFYKMTLRYNLFLDFKIVHKSLLTSKKIIQPELYIRYIYIYIFYIYLSNRYDISKLFLLLLIFFLSFLFNTK